MKKRILSVLLGVIMVGCLTGCKTYQDATIDNEVNTSGDFCGGYFSKITEWSGDFYIVYAKDTKVKYFIKWTPYQFGITPLYNADGTLQVYEESEEN